MSMNSTGDSLFVEQRWEDDLYAVYVDLWDAWPGITLDDVSVKYHEEKAGLVLQPKRDGHTSSQGGVYELLDAVLDGGKEEAEVVWLAEQDVPLAQESAKYHNGVLSVYFAPETRAEETQY